MSENPFDPKLEKYWGRRYDLFALFDRGILLDEEALFSVKPEANALEVAANFSEHAIVDAMCGAGGMAIAFARLGKTVVAVDVSQPRINMALNNAQIYGVADNIVFVNEDIRSLFPFSKMGAAIYFDPPWGGPDYYQKERFTLADFQPPMASLIEMSLAERLTVALAVPVNFDFNEIGRYDADVEIVHSYAWGRRVFSTVFLRA